MATKFQISLEGILDTKTSTANIQKSIKEMEKALKHKVMLLKLPSAQILLILLWYLQQKEKCIVSL